MPAATGSGGECCAALPECTHSGWQGADTKRASSRAAVPGSRSPRRAGAPPPTAARSMCVCAAARAAPPRRPAAPRPGPAPPPPRGQPRSLLPRREQAAGIRAKRAGAPPHPAAQGQARGGAGAQRTPRRRPQQAARGGAPAPGCSGARRLTARPGRRAAALASLRPRAPPLRRGQRGPHPLRRQAGPRLPAARTRAAGPTAGREARPRGRPQKRPCHLRQRRPQRASSDCVPASARAPGRRGAGAGRRARPARGRARSRRAAPAGRRGGWRRDRPASASGCCWRPSRTLRHAPHCTSSAAFIL